MTGRHTTRHITSTLALSTALAVLCALGCGSSKRIAKTNDALRIQREDLRDRVETLEGENAELHVKIAELMQNEDADTAEILAAMPRVASIELTRYCQIEETEDGPVAIFFVTTKDGRGRSIQAVGILKIAINHVVFSFDSFENHNGISADFYSELIGTRTVEPLELRDSYVSGLTGTSYMIRVPLDEMPTHEVTFHANFKDHRTNYWLDAERSVKP